MRIGHDVPFEPFAVIEDGRSTGLIVDLVAEALRRAGIGHRFVPLALDASEGALADGTVDALAFKGVSPERRAKMDFSADIVQTGGALFARAGGAPGTALKDFSGKTVVTPRRGPLVAQLARLAPDIVVVPTTSYEESLDLVLAGKADAAALNFQAGLRLARTQYPGRFALPESPFVALPLAFAVARGRNGDLLARVGAELAGMRADGSFTAIEQRWLGR